MLVLSSPSGAGKTTLSRRLMARDDNLVMSVSVTTRPPRPGEKDGSDYHFLSSKEFDDLLAHDGLLEWAEVFGNRYGTPRKAVEDALAERQTTCCSISIGRAPSSWPGKMAADLVRIFILPPTAEDLRQRLIERAEDSSAVIAKRMAEASSEISHWAEYDYVLINDDLERCDQAISSILHAERLRQTRRIGLSDFVRGLQDNL